MDYITQMEDRANAVEFHDLQTCFFTQNGTVRAVDGVSFAVPKGKIVGIVGESGCGKSVTGLSLMGLLPQKRSRITGGQILLNMDTHVLDLTKLPEKAFRQLRGGDLAMIFQEPMTALNPVLSIGKQLSESIRLHDPTADPTKKALTLLTTVGLPDPRRLMKQYPHNLSGGQRQRVCIAMALAGGPRLIVADEPTTALDVTVQAQILSLLRELTDRLGTAVMLITHDLGVVATVADLVVVMYAGRVVEQGTVEEIFRAPAHPYTLGLMASKPVVGKKTDTLFYIPGTVPSPLELPKNCYFYPRCDRRHRLCDGSYPALIRLSPTHTVSCYREGDAL